MVVIRSFISFLYKNAYISTNIVSDLNVPKRVDKEREYLKDTDIKKIKDYLNKRIERYKGAVVRGTFGKRITSCPLRE